MRKIKLTQGKLALVDDCDYEYLMRWKWYAQKGRKTFYAARREYMGDKQKTILMHRVIAERHGLYLGGDIHHEDDNGLNNQIYNLSGLTRKQHKEIAELRSNNTSGFRGVYLDKRRGKWYAQITHNGKCTHLGYFDKKRDAIKARKAAEKKYFTHG